LAIFSKTGWKFGVSGTPGRGFYINPSRRGPAVPGEGFLDPRQGGAGFQASREALRDPPGPRTPGPAPRFPGVRIPTPRSVESLQAQRPLSAS